MLSGLAMVWARLMWVGLSRWVQRDRGLCRAPEVPGPDVSADVIGESPCGEAVADGAQLPTRRFARFVPTAKGEIGQGVTVDQGWAAGRDGWGASSGVDGGAVGGDAAGSGFGGVE